MSAIEWPTRDMHCTHPDAVHCDCDWCRYIADWRKKNDPNAGVMDDRYMKGEF